MTLLTVRDVAARLGYSRATILRWTSQGILSGFRMPDGALRYREDDLAAWIEERATTGQEGASHSCSQSPSVVA